MYNIMSSKSCAVVLYLNLMQCLTMEKLNLQGAAQKKVIHLLGNYFITLLQLEITKRLT